MGGGLIPRCHFVLKLPMDKELQGYLPAGSNRIPEAAEEINGTLKRDSRSYSSFPK
jgi:hypothetical protein